MYSRPKEDKDMKVRKTRTGGFTCYSDYLEHHFFVGNTSPNNVGYESYGQQISCYAIIESNSKICSLDQFSPCVTLDKEIKNSFF